MSSSERHLEVQRDRALEAEGRAGVDEATVSAARTERSGRYQALDSPRPGDTLGAWQLDRLRRPLGHLIALHARLEQREIGLFGFRLFCPTITSPNAGPRRCASR